MWALYVLIVLISLVAVALCTPVDFIFNLNTSDFSRRRFQMRCFFGLLRVDLHKAEKKEPAETVPAKPTSKKEKPGLRTVMEMLQVAGLFRQIKRLLSCFCRSVTIRQLSADITIGPEDPVHYGYLFAFITPVNYLLGLTPYRVVVNPVFEGQFILECIAEGSVRAYPIMVLGGVLAFAFSGPGFRVMSIAMKKWR